MAAGDFSGPLNILRSLYRHTKTLEEFADAVEFREGGGAGLLQESDPERFRSFVRGVFVCFDKELQSVPSRNQICTLPELLAFVLNSLKRRKKRSVLAHGYNLLSLPHESRDADLFKLQGEVTQCAAYIHGSDLWKKVTLRLGTDIMRHLLESCSVFVAAPPSCIFQICGVPVYDRVCTTTTSSQFYLKPQPRKHRQVRFGGRTQPGKVDVRRRRTRVEHGVKAGKRKREPDQEGDEAQTRKRTHGAPHQCEEVICESERVTFELTSPGPTNESVKQTVEETAAASDHRSGLPSRFPSLSESFIRTLEFMYGGRGMRSFILNRKSGAGRLQGRDLLRNIFFGGLSQLSGHERKPRRLPLRFFNMVPLFEQLLQRHRKCPYTGVLRRMCAAAEGISGPSEVSVSALLQKHTAPYRVFLFIRACLAAVVPEQLWGSDHNRLQFYRKVRGFLSSGKFERLSVGELMWRVKVNDCEWIKIRKTDRVPPSELAYRTRVLGQFLSWLLGIYVVGLVRACFYATESMGRKNAVRFYRLEVWSKLQDLAFRGHLAKGQMEELTPAQAASLPKGTVISRLRFIPKSDSMRPITRITGADAKTRLFQGRVRDLLAILRACVRSTSSLLGSTVWGLSDIHKVLSGPAAAQKVKPQLLYFVKADVSGAFESLPHSKLAEVIGEALSPVRDEVFTIRSFAKIWLGSHEGLRKAFIRHADFLEANMASTTMKGFAMSLQKSGKLRRAILVEQHFCSDIRGRDALEFSTLMLTSSVLQYGKKMYRQCRGIPQGSVVSSLLCCLCYGHMENLYFKGFTSKKGRLMRLVDDFLFITPDQQEAQSFLEKLLAGVPQYGLVVNPQKVAVNFQLSESAEACPDIRVLPPHCLFPWCGLLLDTHTLDVYKDYSSYAGLSLRYSLTLGSVRFPGQQMKRKLMTILRLKCHFLFLDLKMNSLEAVYKNLYKLVLLHACRFHVCVQSLPLGQTVAKNPSYFLRMIWDMARFANVLVRHSNKGLLLGNKAQTGSVQFEAVELLFCLCFLSVLSRHRSVYKDLLGPLHKRKRSLERLLGDLRLARVRQAATPRTPPDFESIQV